MQIYFQYHFFILALDLGIPQLVKQKIGAEDLDHPVLEIFASSRNHSASLKTSYVSDQA